MECINFSPTMIPVLCLKPLKFSRFCLTIIFTIVSFFTIQTNKILESLPDMGIEMYVVLLIIRH